MAYGSGNNSNTSMGTESTNYGVPKEDKIAFGSIEEESYEQALLLQKDIFGKGSSNNQLDVNFSELAKKELKIDVTGFFEQYNRLFLIFLNKENYLILL